MAQLARSKSSFCGLNPVASSNCLRVILIAYFAVALVGCASPEGPRVVQVPVAVRCVPSQAPKTPSVSLNTELANLSDYELVLRIASEWHELKAWAEQIAPVLESCRE